MIIPVIDMQLTENSENSLSFTETFPDKTWSNNVSYMHFILHERATDFRGFQMSLVADHPISTLDGTHKLFSKSADSFISGILPSSGDPSQETLIARFKFVTEGNGYLRYLFVTYDSTSRVFAKHIHVVRGNQADIFKDFYFDKYENICILDVSELYLTNGDTLQVDFYDCNDSTQTIKITRITDALIETLFPDSIVSEEHSENFYDSQLSVKPGLISQYADISVYDRKGILHALALQELLSSDLPVHTGISLDTSLGRRVEYDNTYFVEDWSIMSDSSTINVTCRDKSYILQNTMLQSVGIAQRSVDEMLSVVFKQIGKSWNYLDEYTEKLCKKVIVPNSWFKEATLFETLQKISIVCLLHICAINDTFVVAAIPGLALD